MQLPSCLSGSVASPLGWRDALRTAGPKKKKNDDALRLEIPSPFLCLSLFLFLLLTSSSPPFSLFTLFSYIPNSQLTTEENILLSSLFTQTLHHLIPPLCALFQNRYDFHPWTSVYSKT